MDGGGGIPIRKQYTSLLRHTEALPIRGALLIRQGNNLLEKRIRNCKMPAVDLGLSCVVKGEHSAGRLSNFLGVL